MIDGGALAAAIGISSAMGARPGQVIPMRSPYDSQRRYHEDLMQQSSWLAQEQSMQHLSSLAQLQGQLMFADAMLAAVNHPRRVIRNYVPRKKHRERKFMRKTKAGYRARRTVEVLFWSAVGVVVLGGIVLPVGLRVYTSLWGWALGGG